MAYTIISQNNTTTTLADENGNVITVPARVTLATSTDYTIIKVNNNSVDLESGDGKIIRGVPACIVLAGEGGGGSSLPDQTGQSGKFLTTDGTDASWSNKPLVNTATATNSLTILGNANTTKKDSINIGYNSSVNNFGDIAIGVDSTANGGQEYGVALGYKASDTAPSGVALGAKTKAQGFYTVAIGGNANASQYYSIALGYRAQATASGAIQLGFYNSSATTNSDPNTFKVANANGNFEIMSADGTIPADRLASTTGLADGNYRLRLVMASGVPTLEWVAE